MSITRDKVQVEIEFITDASKAFARTIQETERYRGELKKAQKEVADLSKEEERLAAKGKDATQVALKRAEAEARVSVALKNIAETGKQVEKIDLSKLLPSQLTARANQLRQALQFIPDGHPARVAMEKDLQAINSKLAEMNGRTKAVGGAMDNLRTTGGGLQNFFSSVFAVFLGGGLLDTIQNVFTSVFGYMKAAVTSYGEAARADAQLRASLKSTGDIAGKTFEDLNQSAQDLASVTLFDDDQIKGAEALLLTFTNIRGEIYDRSLPAILDVSQALGQDLKSSSIQVGKALNDPIAGITALSRVGVSFSESQKATITTLVETNRVAEAQTLILKELETEFGGSARAAAEAGLGPFQLIQKRFGEIQESVGGLVERGLRPLSPILGNIATFFEKLTDVILTGKSAQGEFSGAVNTTSAILRGIGQVIYIVYKAVETVVGIWIEWQKILISVAGHIFDFIKSAERMPIVGTIMRAIADQIGLIGDTLTNASATFEGFRAAAAQAIDNVKNYFATLVVSAELLSLKISKALSFDEAKKGIIDAQIAVLESAKNRFAAAGKSVATAYTDARNAAIKQANAEAAQQEQAEAARLAKASGFSIGGLSEDDAKKKQKDFQKQLKEGFDIQLKETELFWERERLANDIAFQKKQRTESEYTEQDYILQIEKYDGLLKIQNTYLTRLKAGSIEYLETEKAILEIEKKRAESAAAIAPRNSQVTELLKTTSTNNAQQSKTGSTLDSLKAQEGLENQFLQEKFGRQAISEINFENEKARLQQQYAERKLAAAEKYGETEKGQIAKLYDQKLAADKNYHDTLRDNEKRTADLKAELEKVKLGIASEGLSVAIDLLSQDEAARKKNAAAIKAFQVAKITVDGIEEVQAIWKNANANPLNALIPGIGTAIAIAQTALAVGRSVVAVGKVNAQKFAQGGFTGGGMDIRDNTGFKVAGVVHEGEYVLPKWMVENKKYQPTIQALEASRISGFALGGFVDTTPRLSGFNTPPQYNQQNDFDLKSLKEEFRLYAQKVDNWANTFSVKLPLNDLEKAQYQKSVDLKDAQF
jgi:hypothetical protein